ncbi:MAG: META domain-containing protein [Flavobacteriales bacterium]
MNRLLLGTLFFATLTAEKCSSDKPATADDAKGMTQVLDSKWVLTALGADAVKMPDGMAAPWLKLGKEGYKVEGHGGCNALMGTFNLEGDRISFPGLGSTKKFCESTMPTENAFLSALKRVDHYTLEGGVLRLLGGGQELATLKPE